MGFLLAACLVTNAILLLLTLGAHAQRGLGSWFVCDVSVCRRLFWHYRLRGGLLAIPAASELREPENKRAIFLKRLRSRDKSSNMHISTGVTVPWGLRKSKRMACIDSRMQSTTVTSPCQTPRATRVARRMNSPAHKLAVSRMRSSPRVCTSIVWHNNSYSRKRDTGPAK